jgi:glyoxylase-like metal-dependent hydrolase (beta-lactamase superfamily II)
LKRPASLCLAALCLAAAGVVAGASPADECPDLQAIADGVYVLPSRGTTPTPANRGRTGNSTILVGATGIVVVDPGPSLKAGRSLQCSITRVSRLPVVAVVNTHAHPQHALANAAFPGAAIHATSVTAGSMRERCPTCRERLAKSIGEAEMDGTEPVIPDHLTDTETTIEPGGRALHLLPLGRAHAQGDLAVIDVASGTLVAGDLANRAGIPEFADGSLAGAIAALRRLQARKDVRRVIPGQGAPYAVDGLAEPLRYLEALHEIAANEVAAGNMTPPARTPPALLRWGEDAQRHSLNLQHALREAEAEWWARPDNNLAPQPDGTGVQQ